MASSQRYDVFVSYSRKDEQLIKRFVQTLTPVGVKVFWDVAEIEPGDRWSTKIDEALEEAPCLYVFWCCDSANSAQVKREIDRAMQLDKKIAGQPPGLAFVV